MKTALITGASRGLGRALARELAQRGYALALVSRSRADLVETVEELRREVGGRLPIIPIAADLGDKKSIHPIAQRALEALGSVDLLINNASDLGPVPLRPLLDTDCEDLERALAVNLVGPFCLTKAILPQMLFRSRGTIVNISSDAADHAYVDWGAYGASKAGLGQLTRIWREELAGAGVRMLSIDPGEMDTRMHRDALPDVDPSTLAHPAEVARRILKELEVV